MKLSAVFFTSLAVVNASVTVKLDSVHDEYRTLRNNNKKKNKNKKENEISGLPISSCSFSDGHTIETTGCNYDAIRAATGCSASDLRDKLNVSDNQTARAKISELCEEALSYIDEQDAYYGYDGFPFERVMAKGYIWDQNFFDGGTEYNSIEDDTSITDQGIRIQAIADNVARSRLIGFPDQKISNFNNCDKNAVMCCYVSKKRSDATDGTPTDNTDVCYHDMSQSQRSARVKNGYAYFGGDAEGEAYCEAFAWDDDVDGPYKGNTLFHVAMEKAFLQNSYTRSVPGAPMCGCIEQMPVVSSAKCTEAHPAQKFTVSADSEGSLYLKLQETDITFTDCGNFSDHYSQRFGTSISDYVVGTCPDIPPFFEELGYVQRDTNWIPIYGKGRFTYPRMGAAEARNLINDGLRIVKRRCTDCVDTHVNIFYKRVTPIPEDFDIMDLFLENWFEKEGNVFNVDFKLYTTLQDAKDDVDPWVYCNYNYDGVGFPRDCGPEKHVGGQWNSVNKGGRVDLLFSIEA